MWTTLLAKWDKSRVYLSQLVGNWVHEIDDSTLLLRSRPYHEISDKRQAPTGIKTVQNSVIMCINFQNFTILQFTITRFLCVDYYKCLGEQLFDWLTRILLYSIRPYCPLPPLPPVQPSPAPFPVLSTPRPAACSHCFHHTALLRPIWHVGEVAVRALLVHPLSD